MEAADGGDHSDARGHRDRQRAVDDRALRRMVRRHQVPVVPRHRLIHERDLVLGLAALYRQPSRAGRAAIGRQRGDTDRYSHTAGMGVRSLVSRWQFSVDAGVGGDADGLPRAEQGPLAPVRLVAHPVLRALAYSLDLDHRLLHRGCLRGSRILRPGARSAPTTSNSPSGRRSSSSECGGGRSCCSCCSLSR